MMLLSEHFSLDEATQSSTAMRYGIDNIPDNNQLAGIKVAAAGMEQIREILGYPVLVDSWLRVEALEKLLTRKDFVRWCNARVLEVNDVSWKTYYSRKAHPNGYAVDFTCPAFGSPSEIVRCLKDSGVKFDQLIMEGDWVHISFAPEMRGEVLIAKFINGVPNYSMEVV